MSLKSCLRHALPTLAVLAAWRWARAPDADPAGPLVRVEQGVLLGAHRFTHRDAIPYFSFQGVPYARPPVGELRFKVSSARPRAEGAKEGSAPESESVAVCLYSPSGLA